MVECNEITNLDVLREVLGEVRYRVDSGMSMFHCDRTKYFLIIQALDKQIPKKPIAVRETLLGSIVSDRIISFTCPNCYHKDIGNNEFRYPCCEECGQALDWSEYNG